MSVFAAEDDEDEEDDDVPLLNDGGGGGVAPPAGVVGIKAGAPVVAVDFLFLTLLSSIKRGAATASTSVPSAS